jgi:hypothetical protein
MVAYFSQHVFLSLVVIVLVLAFLIIIMSITTVDDSHSHSGTVVIREPLANRGAGGGGAWDPSLVNDFLTQQSVYNPNVVFTMSEVQKQASPEEVETYLRTGQWPWDDDLQDIFRTTVQEDPMVRQNEDHALTETRTLYNASIAQEVLSWKAPEGQFLLTGVLVDSHGADKRDGWGDYAQRAGLSRPDQDVVRCGTLPGEADDAALQPIRLHPSGRQVFTHAPEWQVSAVDPASLPSVVPGFSFVQGTCNPCVALASPSDTSCPFTLHGGDGGDDTVSPIWTYRWGL